jgi:hypothetical protein
MDQLIVNHSLDSEQEQNIKIVIYDQDYSKNLMVANYNRINIE